MKAGFRTPPAPSKKDQMRNIETELKNMQMAARISQMMTQQLMQSVKTMSDDMGAALNQLAVLQYNFNAVTKHLKIDAKTINDIANEQRLVDFNASAAKQDVLDQMTDGTTVEANSTIVITSTAVDAEGNDAGIFRSRLKLAECGVPDFITAMAGKSVGDKVEVKLNGLDHVVELLAVRNPPVAQAETTAEATH